MGRAHDDGMPWAALMEIGLGLLCLTPAVFWQMTPGEWKAALRGWKKQRGITDADAMGRDELEMLMRRFPDAVTAERRSTGL